MDIEEMKADIIKYALEKHNLIISISTFMVREKYLSVDEVKKIIERITFIKDYARHNNTPEYTDNRTAITNILILNKNVKLTTIAKALKRHHTTIIYNRKRHQNLYNRDDFYTNIYNNMFEKYNRINTKF